MRWSYRQHTFILNLLHYPDVVRKFIVNLSWSYAHYYSPDFEQRFGWCPNRPSFWENVKYQWRASVIELG